VITFEEEPVSAQTMAVRLAEVRNVSLPSKSEIQGLTWEAYDHAAGEIKVTLAWSTANVAIRKRRRGKPVSLSSRLCELLDLYRLRLGNPTTGVMFATEVLTPLCLHNLFTRQIDPIINACGECGEPRKKHGEADHEYTRRSDLPAWHGWHALRRGLGSNLNELGVPDLTIQRILRHSNVATTRKSYIKIREDNVTAGMAQLEAEIRRTETAQLEAETHKAERLN
jgi:integrase